MGNNVTPIPTTQRPSAPQRVRDPHAPTTGSWFMAGGAALTLGGTAALSTVLLPPALRYRSLPAAGIAIGLGLPMATTGLILSGSKKSSPGRITVNEIAKPLAITGLVGGGMGALAGGMGGLMWYPEMTAAGRTSAKAGLIGGTIVATAGYAALGVGAIIANAKDT
jgi:hypothetical protein